MFERYSDEALRTVYFAREEAARVGSPYIEPEHLLLGLLRGSPDLAQRITSGSDLDAVRSELLGSVSAVAIPARDLPLSRPSKRMLAYSAEEAERMRHQRIGAGHLLLGLLGEPDTVAKRFLEQRGFDLQQMRSEVRQAGLETEGPPD